MATTVTAGHGVARAAKEVKRPYVLVFGFLFVVTVIEVQIPNLAIAQTSQIVLLVASAVVKATLVALYYMHLRYEPRVLKLLPIGPLVFVALLVLTVVAH